MYFPLLKKALKRLGVLPPETKEEFQIMLAKNQGKKYLIIDVSEREIARSTNYQTQKEFFSGKKKKTYNQKHFTHKR